MTIWIWNEYESYP